MDQVETLIPKLECASLMLKGLVPFQTRTSWTSKTLCGQDQGHGSC